MILYHCTGLEFLPSIREQGLLPHVPGVVWQNGDPYIARMTGGVPVVWLTLDKSEWRHDAHPTDPRPDGRMLTVQLERDGKRLVRYLPWLREHIPEIYKSVKANGFQGQSVSKWHVYFGTIPPERIIAGLGDERRAAA